jgi:low molecular weight protein-tyrosine phosphatase
MSYSGSVLKLSNSLSAGRTQPVKTAEKSIGTLSILAVCTGNVCRSPAVERLLSRDLGPTVFVSSAGTHALVGQPISEPMARLLRRNGVPDGAFVARRLTESLVKGSDLVLALTRAQRSLVVELWPPAIRRTFTVREFARLLKRIDRSALPEGNPAERLGAAVPLAAAQRGHRLASPQADDVVDPFRLSDDVYAASFAEITSAVNVIVRAIGISDPATESGTLRKRLEVGP